MDARQLSILRELGDRGSVTAVAQALFITPSAVSQQLAVLQRGVPVALTQRRGRSLVLTDAGRALADAATDVATALARAELAVDAFLDDPRGTVRVAAFSSAAAAFFPALLQAGPTVECAEHDVSQSRFPALCADHDVVLAHRLDSSPPWPDTIAVTALLHEPLDVAVPMGHALARQETVTAEQVVAEPWVAVHEGFPLLAPLEAIAAAAGRPLTIAHRINDLTVAAGLVTAGAGLALMPRHTSPSAPGLVLRPVRGMELARHIDALVRPERALRSSVRTVLATLTSAAGHLVASTA
jgi:DNA-binding transcriptional LysR family regulator